VYGDDAVHHSTVSRWAAGIEDSPHTGRPHTAQTPDSVQRVKDMVLEDCDYKINVSQIGNWGSKCAQNIETVGVEPFCARWVPRMLTDAHKETRKTVCSELLAQCDNCDGRSNMAAQF
jgi:hypothetical protein